MNSLPRSLKLRVPNPSRDASAVDLPEWPRAPAPSSIPSVLRPAGGRPPVNARAAPAPRQSLPPAGPARPAVQQPAQYRPYRPPSDPAIAGARMRTNPETGRQEVWKLPSAEEDDSAHAHVQAQALQLRERIAGPRPGAIDVGDPLDARCLDAAMLGTGVVDLRDIDMSRYRR